jgi:hypothetical protein
LPSGLCQQVELYKTERQKSAAAAAKLEVDVKERDKSITRLQEELDRLKVRGAEAKRRLCESRSCLWAGNEQQAGALAGRPTLRRRNSWQAPAWRRWSSSVRSRRPPKTWKPAICNCRLARSTGQQLYRTPPPLRPFPTCPLPVVCRTHPPPARPPRLPSPLLPWPGKMRSGAAQDTVNEERRLRKKYYNMMEDMKVGRGRGALALVAPSPCCLLLGFGARPPCADGWGPLPTGG